MKPKLTEFPNGDKQWWLNDKLHREDGPAIEYADGTKFWWVNDKLHREDGPALEYPSGHKEWWLNGKEYTEEEYVMVQFMKGVSVYVDNC